MSTVVLTIHLLLAFGLIVVVLLQRSEGGGLGIGGGGGGIMTGRGAATALSKVTWALGIAFVATSLTLTIIAARETASESILDRFGTSAGEMPTGDADPAVPPGLGDDLLPPIPVAPSAPQAEDGSPAVPPPLD